MTDRETHYHLDNLFHIHTQHANGTPSEQALSLAAHRAAMDWLGTHRSYTVQDIAHTLPSRHWGYVMGATPLPDPTPEEEATLAHWRARLHEWTRTANAVPRKLQLTDPALYGAACTFGMDITTMLTPEQARTLWMTSPHAADAARAYRTHFPRSDMFQDYLAANGGLPHEGVGTHVLQDVQASLAKMAKKGIPLRVQKRLRKSSTDPRLVLAFLALDPTSLPSGLVVPHFAQDREDEGSHIVFYRKVHALLRRKPTAHQRLRAHAFAPVLKTHIPAILSGTWKEALDTGAALLPSPS